MRPYNYSDYETQLMDTEYIRMLQRPRVRFFKDCKRVLDLACGPGVFLQLLKEAGIGAVGVDRNEEIVNKVRLKHLRVMHSDIFDYLKKVEEKYDAMFCSHFLEHLPFHQVVQLIELITMRLDSKGILVFVLPNPGSIRLHLFGFWRDPEHIRFYTGSLIASVCRHYGLEIEYSNEEETPNLLEIPKMEPFPMSSSNPTLKGILHKKSDQFELFRQEFNKRIEAFNEKIVRFSETLNKIWARDDEVVLVCRKGGEEQPKRYEGP